MFSIDDRAPAYLFGKYQLTLTVISTVLFSLVFMLVSIPYSHNAWFRLGEDQAFAFTAIFVVISVLLVVVSKKLMSEVHLRMEFTYLQYILWNVGEAVLISFLYTFFTLEGEKYGIIAPEHSGFDSLFFNALAYVSVSLGVPYVVCGQYFAIQDKDNTIRLMNFSNVVGDEELPPHGSKRITLFDNNGVLKLSIGSENLYFIESDDNYIKVWYTDSTGEMKQYMLRCRLKTVEESFRDSDLVRCHRKYVVNMGKVGILKAVKDGYCIDLGLESVDPIPVSKTYEEEVLARFNSR